MTSDDRYTEIFCPHLWRQRRTFILETLQRFKVRTVLDYGCGEAAVLSYLIPSNEHPITKISGIDLCNQVLTEAIDRCTPWQMDYDQLRDHPLAIDLYQGSIGVPDDRFKGFQGIICTEVIEHVYSDVLDKFMSITLGVYQPEIMIVTTPNAEYNVNFPDLKYGTSESTFRHDDHKFEWTRKEFESWCENGAERYGYDVEYHGIGLLHGKYDELDNGHCTQACVFTRRSSDVRDTTHYGEPHILVKHIEYPYHNEVPLSTEHITNETLHYVEALCKSESYAEENLRTKETFKPNISSEEHKSSLDVDQINDWTNFNLEDYIPSTDKGTLPEPHTRATHTKIPFTLPISNLWDVLRLRQICGNNVEYMLDILLKLDKEEYEVVNSETLVVKKAFALEWDDDDNLSAKTFSSHNSYED